MKKLIKLLTKQIIKAKEMRKPKIFIQTLQQQLDKVINQREKDNAKER